ncbi:class A beta-lactamase-related serine hydrolase [Nocardia yunnanensis]|uniref:Class A beta-lactamase-related serine hydrolase n=1 Tax=Nocardia yunnanensis TaxID=2382165 RepID=A0A386ZG73_9NOCA|nr:serine hydrolase domain-containing protein [Nocardia yunnanensis]AYF76440.1 class A beta-lactamase-related serine hydrolase [Nocardia yunnanensis]
MRIGWSAAVVVLVAAAGCGSVATTAPQPVSTTPMAVSPQRIEKIRADIDALVRSGSPGAIATVTEHGQTVTLTAGVGDRGSGAPIPMAPPQQVRVGSISKTFAAALLMQLVSEGKLRLDEPVDTYLPGLLTGDGVDGRAITVRQILQHRSGLPELSDDPEVDVVRAVAAGRTFTPAQEIAIALRKPAQFAPGEKFKYTNTNFIVAGMLVEKVTGRAYSEELNGRILTPTQLPDTYLPGPGEVDFRGPHPHGYATVDGTLTDVTRSEPSVAWSAGGMIASGNDLNRFFLALLAGKIVPDAQLREMLATQPAWPNNPMKYGLGIGSTDLPCGAQFYGHEGEIAGYITLSGATHDGRAVTLTLNASLDNQPDWTNILSDALCP